MGNALRSIYKIAKEQQPPATAPRPQDFRTLCLHAQTTRILSELVCLPKDLTATFTVKSGQLCLSTLKAPLNTIRLIHKAKVKSSGRRDVHVLLHCVRLRNRLSGRLADWWLSRWELDVVFDCVVISAQNRRRDLR